MAKPEKLPEWEIFKRVEGLEELTLDLMSKSDAAEPTLKKTAVEAHDAKVLATLGFIIDFVNNVQEYPSTGRKVKDDMIALMKNAGVSSELVSFLEDSMINICESVEKEHQA